jgi:uncharacterized protein YndB with AHSA1/START domain
MSDLAAIQRTFTVHRVVNAPRSVVFRAWTEPDGLRWFFTDGTPPDEPVRVDLRVGGEWRQRMIVDAQTDYITGGIYREIIPGERLSFFWGAVGGWPELDGGAVHDAPIASVLLTDLGGRTELRFAVGLPVHLSDQQVAEWLATGMRQGWGDTIDRLVASLERVGA